MSTKHKWFVIIGLLLLIAVAVGGLYWVWTQPIFGKPLPLQSLLAASTPPGSELATSNPTPEGMASPAMESISSTEGVTETPYAATELHTQKAESEQKIPGAEQAEELAPCSTAEAMTVGVLGIDENELADAIRLVRVDFAEGRVSVVSIPRDFWVPIVDMQEHGIDYGRINSTYGYGEYFHGNGEGIISLARNIQANFGVNFDHYLVLHFADIQKYIDLIGGVDVVLAEPAYDRERQFTSGEHHFDGETAVIFMRMREGDSDFYRVRRQSLVLTAFYKKMKNELNLWQQVKLALAIIYDRSIKTDISAKDVFTLVCLARQIDSTDVAFIEIPSDLYHPTITSGGASVIIPHDGVGGFLQSVMDGSYKSEN